MMYNIENKFLNIKYSEHFIFEKQCVLKTLTYNVLVNIGGSALFFSLLNKIT